MSVGDDFHGSEQAAELEHRAILDAWEKLDIPGKGDGPTHCRAFCAGWDAAEKYFKGKESQHGQEPTSVDRSGA